MQLSYNVDYNAVSYWVKQRRNDSIENGLLLDYIEL